MTLRRIAVCLLAVMAFPCILAVGLASAQTGVSYNFTPPQGSIGTIISFSGSGCLPDNNPDRADGRFETYITVSENQEKFGAVGEFASNPNGSFSGSATVRSNATPGLYHTRVVCGSSKYSGADFRVIGATTTTVATSTTVVSTPTTASVSTTVAPPTAPPATTSTVVRPTSVVDASIPTPRPQLAYTGFSWKPVFLALFLVSLGVWLLLAQSGGFGPITGLLEAVLRRH